MVGFSGTRRGMSKMQKKAVQGRLEFHYAQGERKFAHGMCVGADEEALRIATEIGYTTFAYPGTITAERASFPSTVTYAPMANLERNKFIVKESRIMVIAPLQMQEVMRSGTWATYRYARAAGKYIELVRRDGTWQMW